MLICFSCITTSKTPLAASRVPVSIALLRTYAITARKPCSPRAAHFKCCRQRLASYSGISHVDGEEVDLVFLVFTSVVCLTFEQGLAQILASQD